MKISLKRKKDSFSILESLIAIALISVVIGSVFSLIFNADKIFLRNIDKERMNIIANNIIEDLKADIINLPNYSSSGGTTINISDNSYTNSSITYLNDWKNYVIDFDLSNSNIVITTTSQTVNGMVINKYLATITLTKLSNTSLLSDIEIIRTGVIND